MEDGSVIDIDDNTIKIKHKNIKILYGNIRNIKKEKNNQVEKGEIIGEASKDFYIKAFKNNKIINPDKYIDEDLMHKITTKTQRDYWESNVDAYNSQISNNEYFKTIKIEGDKLEVHPKLVEVISDIKNDKSYRWSFDEVIIIGDKNLYNKEKYNIDILPTSKQKNILNHVGLMVFFDQNPSKAISINKYFYDMIELLNINKIYSIIIYNEGIYFDVGPMQLINENDNINEPFSKIQ